MSKSFEPNTRNDLMHPDVQIVNGQLVERDALRIAEKVNDLNPNLYVQCLESAPTLLGEPPFRIIERCRDGKDRILFSFWTLDDTVIMRIRAADMSKQDVLAKIEKNNLNVKAAQRAAAKEQFAEGSEIAYAVMKSKKSSYSVPVEGEKTTFFEDRPAERG